MALSLPKLASLLALLGLLSQHAVAATMTKADYGKKFSGDGTYYGYTEGGNCAMRGPQAAAHRGMLPVAINNAQYGDSASCGACILITKGGRGLGANPIDTSGGPIRAYVHDRCPECKYGDLDLSMSGDGRWHIEWQFVPCFASDGKVTVLFEGSNQFYRKMQFRGTRSPVVRAVANGKVGSKTQDNFFEFHGSLSRVVRVDLTTVQGDIVSIVMTRWLTDGIMEVASRSKSSFVNTPAAPFGFSGGRPKPAPRPAPKPAPKKPQRKPQRKPRCVPTWMPCSGRKNWWRTSRCCNRRHRCRRTTRWGPKRCAPPRRPRRRGRRGRCVPKWKACSGRNNWWGTTRCCGGWRCVKASIRGFHERNRCEPPRRRWK